VEVILAIVIALGVLVVVLYFYQQATNLRAQAIQETERIGAARLLMDRITSELRTSQSDPALGQAFVGSSNSIQFVKTDVPSFSYWVGGPLGRSLTPVSDLKVLTYRLESSDGTNVGGLLRSEESLVPKQQLAATQESAEAAPPLSSPTNTTSAPLIEEVRYLQFRFWSGTNWLDSWSAPGTPEAVEVSLGAEPMTNGTELVEYPGEIFRRVIYLAGQSFSQIGPAAVKSGAPEPNRSEEGSP
jgi:hypothetical protein